MLDYVVLLHHTRSTLLEQLNLFQPVSAVSARVSRAPLDYNHTTDKFIS